MGHVVLLGDSIFDNGAYVPERAPVIEQVQRELPREWRATLLAVDGGMTDDVAVQLRKLPADATHLVVSAGGNDALGESQILNERVDSIAGAMRAMQEVRARFRQSYREMLAALAEVRKPTVLCTIYDAIPDLGEAQAALALINEIILREAIAVRAPIIDLRLVCDRPDDYSHVSPIEPSFLGGAKIARAIAEVVTQHDFQSGRCGVYW